MKQIAIYKLIALLINQIAINIPTTLCLLNEIYFYLFLNPH